MAEAGLNLQPTIHRGCIFWTVASAQSQNCIDNILHAPNISTSNMLVPINMAPTCMSPNSNRSHDK